MEYNGDDPDRHRRVEWMRLILVVGSVVAVSAFAAALTKAYVSFLSPLPSTAANGDHSGLACGILIPYVELAFLISFSVALVWALYLYATLRQHDDDEQRYIERNKHKPGEPLLASINYNWIPRNNSKGENGLTRPSKHDEEKDNINKYAEEHYPYSFHQLAHTHRHWAQLWFTITIAIFIGGLMYAVFNVATHLCGVGPVATSWFVAAKIIIPNVFAYALFFIAWNWSSRHFRSHWHNFIVNSYRHRALWRYEEIERKLIEIASGVGAPENNRAVEETVKKVRDKVADTLMELHRLSGILLLFPGDSSYSDAGSDEKAAEELVKLEEVVRSATGRAIKT
ncbi:MAG: hypothetical protein U0S49_11470 [Rhodospirillales bacterium]|nr:hypothetical protein [Rhodospirillales bacterium]